MKKILIISYVFAPRAEIGAVRWTKLAKYLQDHDIISDVITLVETKDQDELLARDAEQLKGRIFRISHSEESFMPKFTPRKPYAEKVDAALVGINRFKRGRFGMYLQNLRGKKARMQGMWKSYYQGQDFCDQTIKYIQENGIRPDEYDDVVVSFGPVGSALVAAKLKELYPDCRLVMDFRDPMNNFQQPADMNRLYEGIQDKLCEVADVVIAVGNSGYADKIFKAEDKSKLHVITNGYDPADKEGIEAVNDGKFSFVFTGSLYDGLRDISSLFEVLSALVKDGVIRREDIVFKHAGGNFPKLMVQAQRYGMGDVLRDYGMITRRQCLELQRSTRFLVFSSWNFRNKECTLNGKLFEYMLMERPIIGIATGDVPNSEGRQIVEACNVGVVYEHGDKKASRAALYEYLKADYERYKQGLDSLYEPVQSELEKYDYRNIAERIAKLL